MNIKLAGDRVFLAPMDVNDSPLYVEWLNNPEIAVYLYALRQVINGENEVEFIRETARRGDHNFGIRLLADGRLIGNCGFINVDHIVGKAEMGIFIGDQDCRNQGIGVEAVKLLLDYGFNILNLHVIWLKVFSFNHRARSCYEKSGFHLAGAIREAVCIAGRRYDEIIMDILASEFPSYKVAAVLEQTSTRQ